MPKVASNMNPRLAVVYTTLNSMRTIERSIRSALAITDWIIVVDSGSTDGTVQACSALGAQVHHQDWLGFARQKQHAIDLAGEADWILLLDSDEILEPRLVDSVRQVVSGGGAGIDAWEMDRHLWYEGGYLRICRPDRVVRLFRRGSARMPIAGGVHRDLLQVRGRTGRLDGWARHESWASLEDALVRNIRYAAMASREPNQRTSLAKIAINGPWAFVRAYILQGGALDGMRGLEASLARAVATTCKHLLIASNRRARTRLTPPARTPSVR
jgi:glycosyltransferase involved in cell wall biosynthesis